MNLLRFFALILVTLTVAAVETRKPNVIVFLCDDVGWGEFGFQGNKQIPTPHIDSIASNGIRFTQGYVSGPYCSPSISLVSSLFPSCFLSFPSISLVSSLFPSCFFSFHYLPSIYSMPYFCLLFTLVLVVHIVFYNPYLPLFL